MKKVLTNKEIAALESDVCPKCNSKGLYHFGLREGSENLYCANGHYFCLSKNHPSVYLDYMPPGETRSC